MVELKKAGPVDYVRFVFSSIILLFCSVVTIYAIVMKKTLFWDVVPGWAALILFLLDIFCLGVVEGLQIALVELKRQHPDSYRKTHPRAYAIGQTAFTGDNVERFLMGRQVFVVLLVFFAAKLTTIYVEEGEDFLFPTTWWVRAIFLESGILGCITLVIIAQLMPQIVAAKFPVHFLQFIIMRPAYYICIGVEMTGLTHSCWLLSAFMQFCFRIKDDKTTINPVQMMVDSDLSLVSSHSDSQNKDGSEEESCMEESTVALCKVPDSDQSNIAQQRHDSPTLGAEVNRPHLWIELQNYISEDMAAIYRQYLDSHPEKFAAFPSVIGNKVFTSPGELATQMRRAGQIVPSFLLDISDPQHIPPHIVACELTQLVLLQRNEIEQLQARLGKLEHAL